MNILFNEIVGNEVAVSMLQNIINTGNIAPAYLFTGISGIGKFKAALLFAQHLIESQFELLIIQPEGANNNIKIEQVREASAWCATKPAMGESTLACRFPSCQSGEPRRGDRKVVIINAEGGLSEKCSNAILKTLEEPPSYVTIIIVSNSEMLPTINSRCHRIDFKQLSQEEVVAVLESNGNVNVHEAIINASYGSPGKALQILEVWDELSGFVENLSTPPTTISEALNHSNEISKLEHSSQLLLIQMLGLTWWTKLKDPRLLGKCTTGIQFLDKVNARAVWDNLLIPM